MTIGAVVRVGSGYALIFLLGFLDYKTGFEISFAFFYLIPVVISVWYGNWVHGLTAAVFSAITWTGRR